MYSPCNSWWLLKLVTQTSKKHILASCEKILVVVFIQNYLCDPKLAEPASKAMVFAS